jgi:tripartite-type tricarboxylate transporter receptor subunit TctC
MTGFSCPTSSPFSRRTALGLCIAGVTGHADTAGAQSAAADWPTRAVRYTEVFGPGSPTDIASRTWCAAMAEVTGQQFLVENRAGAGGTLGAAAIARSTPDGYSVGYVGIGQLAIAPTLYARLPYDPTRDFSFVSGQWRQPFLLVVNNELPARSVAEFIDLLKREPGRHTYGHGGIGAAGHLSGEIFKSRAGVVMEHVGYPGPQGQIDLIAGRISALFAPFSAVIAGVRDGRIRALAVTTLERSPAAPEVPALSETLPGFDLTVWAVVAGPAGLPAPLVERMHRLSRQALERPELVQRFRQSGITPWPAAPAEITAYRAEQQALLAPVIRASGARVE